MVTAATEVGEGGGEQAERAGRGEYTADEQAK